MRDLIKFGYIVELISLPEYDEFMPKFIIQSICLRLFNVQ